MHTPLQVGGNKYGPSSVNVFAFYLMFPYRRSSGNCAKYTILVSKAIKSKRSIIRSILRNL